MRYLWRPWAHPGFHAQPIWFSLALASYWASNGALYAFISLYLRSLGYSSAVCGLATGSLWIFSLVVQPAIGYISDTYISSKKLLLLCFGVAVPFTALLPFAAGRGGLIFVAFICQSVLDNYQYCLLDAWIIQAGRTHSYVDFGRIRAFGSLGYALSALLMGSLIDRMGFWVMFAFHAGLLVLCMLCITRIEAAPCLNQSEEGGGKGLSILEVMGRLISNRTYIIVLLSVALYQFGIRPAASYFSMVTAALGGGSRHAGAGTFVCAFGEVFVMMLVSKLMRRGVRMELLYAVGLICGVVRLGLMSLPLGVGALIAGQALSSVTVGIYIRVFPQLVGSLTPPNISGTATTIAAAVTFFFGGVLGNLSGGYIMEMLGTYGYIRLCALMMLLACGVFLPVLVPALRQRTATPAAGSSPARPRVLASAAGRVRPGAK